MTLHEATTTTMSYLRSRGLAPGTILRYESGLRLLLAYLRERGINDPRDVTYPVLIDYMGYLQERPRFDGRSGPLAVATVNTYIKAIRGHFGYLHETGVLLENPAANIKCLRGKQCVIQSFSVEQLAALHAVVPIDTFVGRRNRLLYLVLLDCGLRISEALSLQPQQVFFTDRLLRVTGKGGKERLVPFGVRVKEGLQNWIAEYSLPVEDNIFFGARRSTITGAGIREHLRVYGQKAGIAGVEVRPHVFRHTFAVLFLRNGGNPFVLQRILGHSTLEMTRIYVNLLTDDLQREHALYGPGDRLDFLGAVG